MQPKNENQGTGNFLVTVFLGILYIAVELCGMGDLERFLKTNRTLFTSATRIEHTERNRIYEQTRWRNA